MASVPQQMPQNMVFAAAPQMATPQGPLLLATNQPMAQTINGQMGQYIQTTGYPTTGFVTQGPNQYMTMNPYPVMMNGYQATNSVQNLAIQIPQNNGQQLIATTPTQMTMQQAPQQHHQQQQQPQQTTGTKGQKGQQMGGTPQMMKNQGVTANKSLHPGNQMQQAQQNGPQPQLIQPQPGAYFIQNGQTFQAVAPQPQPQQQQMPQPPPPQQQQNSNKKANNTKGQKGQTTPKPIQIQSPLLQQAQYKPANGMQQANIQPAPIQFAQNGQQIMFSPMQPTQAIWSPQPVQQGQFVTQPQQVVLRSPQGDQTAMVLQQPGQPSQYQMGPVQLQGQPGQQPGTPTMMTNQPQQQVIQMSNGTYAQVAPAPTATTPTTPTKQSILIQPKIQENTPKAPPKMPVKVVPNHVGNKSDSAVKLAPKMPSGPPAGNVKSTGTGPARSSFPTLNGSQAKTNVRSVTTGTNTQATRTVNTQVSSKKTGPEKRSQATGNAPISQQNPPAKKEPKSDIIQHFVDGHIVLESKQPFPCEPEVESKTGNTKAKPDPKEKENITTVTLPNSNNAGSGKAKTANVAPEKVEKAEKKPAPERKLPVQNGAKFAPIASKPTPPQLPPAHLPLPQPPTPMPPKMSSSKSISTGNSTGAGNKRPASAKLEFKPAEKVQKIQIAPQVPLPVVQPVAPVPVPPVQAQPEPEVRPAADAAPALWLPANNKHPDQWDVKDVCDFISHIDDCKQFAPEFEAEEIDGTALMLIKEKHLVKILKAKWGTALKIYKKIEDVKRRFQISNNN